MAPPDDNTRSFDEPSPRERFRTILGQSLSSFVTAPPKALDLSLKKYSKIEQLLDRNTKLPTYKSLSAR